MRSKLNAISVLFFIHIHAIAFAATSEQDYLKEISKLSEAGKKEELYQTSKKFFREYPGSNLIADVRLILAENEQDPQKAVGQFRTLVNKYGHFKKRDFAQHKICEILYLEAKWSELRAESQKGIELFKNSEYHIKFRFFLVRAYIYLEQFDLAKKACLDITKQDHTYNNLSDALLLLSYINRNIYGLARSYLYSLSEIISGFKDSNNMPAALFLLGRYYESRGEYNKAFSAYSDAARKFPRSPEAGYSKNHLASIAQHSPVKTDYIPDKTTIEKLNKIDIQPEIDIEEDKINAESSAQYSISLGPFNNINNAREIKSLINKDFQPVEIAGIRNGYAVYTGRFTSIDSAIKTKIRLAEEFGINGNIVKIIKDAKKLYIYEE